MIAHTYSKLCISESNSAQSCSPLMLQSLIMNTLLMLEENPSGHLFLGLGKATLIAHSVPPSLGKIP